MMKRLVLLSFLAFNAEATIFVNNWTRYGYYLTVKGSDCRTKVYIPGCQRKIMSSVALGTPVGVFDIVLQETFLNFFSRLETPGQQPQSAITFTKNKAADGSISLTIASDPHQGALLKKALVYFFLNNVGPYQDGEPQRSGNHLRGRRD